MAGRQASNYMRQLTIYYSFLPVVQILPRGQMQFMLTQYPYIICGSKVSPVDMFSTSPVRGKKCYQSCLNVTSLFWGLLDMVTQAEALLPNHFDNLTRYDTFPSHLNCTRCHWDDPQNTQKKQLHPCIPKTKTEATMFFSTLDMTGTN